MLVINEAVNSRCGHPITANCSCGGHADKPADGEYTGRYSKWWNGEKDDERVANVAKPSPLPVPVWSFADGPVENSKVVENVEPELYEGHGLYAGAAAGQQIRNAKRADDKPTPLPVQAWKF